VVVSLIVSSWRLYTTTEVNKITLFLGSATPQEPPAERNADNTVITEKF
jgi:hypothetical protein